MSDIVITCIILLYVVPMVICLISAAQQASIYKASINRSNFIMALIPGLNLVVACITIGLRVIFWAFLHK